MSKAQFGKVPWKTYAVNTNRKKTGSRIKTSQGDLVFKKDTLLLDNSEQAAELKEKHPGIIKTVQREAPVYSGRFSMLVPELPWKRKEESGAG